MPPTSFVTVQTQSDRGIVSLHGDQLDIFDASALAGDADALVTGNDLEMCLRVAQPLAKITISCVSAMPAAAAMIGEATLDLPTGRLIVSAGTLGAQGPFPVPDGPGLYRVRVLTDTVLRDETATAVTEIVVSSPDAMAITSGVSLLHGREAYTVEFTRLGDSPADADDL
jgi:hypothetical protein